MLDEYFECQRTLTRLRSGPAGAHLNGFSGWLKGQGFKWDTVRRFIGGSNRFGTWAESRGVEVGELDQARLDSFGKHLAACGRLRDRNGAYTIAFRGARHFVAYLRATGVLPELISPASELPPVVEEFHRWMQVHRGVRDSTLRQHTRVVLDLVGSLGENSSFTAEHVRTFVFDQSSRGGIGRAKSIASSARLFLRFLAAVGRCHPGAEHAIPNVAHWSLAALPKYLQPEEVEHVIDACDSATLLGARDRAMILLMARLALRASDIAALRLPDLDWKDATLMVAGKNRRESRLPLPSDVGEAIRFYVEEYRPHVENDRVFISTNAPLRPVSSVTVSGTARRAIRRAGIEAPSYGAHLFRHSAATGMLRQGASLQTIGTVLRHESIETTALYAKVDVDLLKDIAMPWPEVETC